MKTAIVTGGTKGIGYSIVEKFSKEGLRVIFCARNSDNVEDAQKKLRNQYHEEIYGFAVDVSNKKQIDSFVRSIYDINSTTDILVNNAGVFKPGDVHEEPDGQLEDLLQTNLMSAYHLSRALIPTMKVQASGHIFNICSIASLEAYPPGGSYSISKFAMHGLTKALRSELKAHGISVTSVIPGATYSSSWEGTNIDPKRLMNAEDIASMVFAISSLGSGTVVEDIILRPQEGDL